MANKSTKAATSERKTIKVIGVVEFYGKVDTYNKKNGKLKEGEPEKEYMLVLKDYELKGFDEDEVKKWYTNDRGKVELPSMYEDIIDGDMPDLLYFHSQYPIDTFQTLKDGNVVEKKIDYNPDLKGCRVSMAMFRQYIGRVAIAELPPEYSPIAFDAGEFADL